MIEHSHHERITNANRAIARSPGVVRDATASARRHEHTPTGRLRREGRTRVSSLGPRDKTELAEPTRDRRRESIRRAVGHGEKHVGFDELELHQPK